MDKNDRFSCCPLSGLPLVKQGGEVTIGSYFFLVDTDYDDEPIYYGLTNDFIETILPSLSSREKEKMWSVIIEKSLQKEKSFLIGTSTYGTKKVGNKYWILYSYLDLLKLYPTWEDLFSRIVGNIIKYGGEEEIFPEIEISYLVEGNHFGWELFFVKNWNQIISIGEELSERGFVRMRELDNNHYLFTLTSKGLDFYHGIQNDRNNSSDTCFVAMKFGKGDDGRDMMNFFESVIRPAVDEANYKAIIVSDILNDNKICDNVIAGIRNAKFVIVDLTYGNLGAYYEAGFAYGIGKPIIYICEETWFQDGKYDINSDSEIYTPKNKGAPNGVHFDINHYNIIKYSVVGDGLEKLKKELISNISARIVT